MRIPPQYARPGNDGWDPLHGDYYKQYSALIADPQLRAIAEARTQNIVREAEEQRKAREVERHQEMVKALEASRQKSRLALQTDEPRNYQEELRFLEEQNKGRRSKRQAVRQEQSILLQQQNEERERKRLAAEQEQRILLQQQTEDRERKRQQLEQEETARQVQASLYRERLRAADEEIVGVARARIERERRASEQEEAARYHRRITARARHELEEMERSHQANRVQSVAPRPSPAFTPRNANLPGGTWAMQADTAIQEQQELYERHKDIVSAAIEAVGAQAASSGQKRSHTEFDESSKAPQSTPQPPKKPENAFSKMMRAPQKITDTPRDFSQWDAHLQQALDDQVLSGRIRNETDWASIVTETIKLSFETMIFPYLRYRAHPQTKINALHVLIEVATATAYAPRSTAADLIRNGSLPKTLLSNMLEIAERMSGSERNAVLEEQAFLCKVKTLRYQPMIPWGRNTWTALDEVLRLMKDPGPVGFRMIFDQLSSQIRSGRSVMSIATAVRRIIKSDITSYVTPSTCFETKYNAMNVLADAGALAMRELGSLYRDPMDILGEIAAALLDLGKMLDGDEVRKIHVEMVQEADFSSADFLNHFLECIDDNIVVFKTRNNQQFKRDYDFKSSSCAKFQLFVEKKKAEKKRAHGNDGLLAKILLLRWNNNAYDPKWFKCRDDLDDLLEMLVDGSVPLMCDRYHWKVDSVLQSAGIEGLNVYTHEKLAKESRSAVDRNIAYVLALARKGCMETKINAFKTLAKIGMKMIEWMSPGRPRWQLDVFKDHLSEDAVTDAMMVICDSIVKMGGIKGLSDQDLGIVSQLDVLRAPVPEAFEGLDGVLDIIRDPSKMGTRDEKRVISLAVLKSKTVIDLTDD